MDYLKSLMDRMVKEKRLTIHNPERFSWGDKKKCEKIFREIFVKVDQSLATYEHLPEYDEVVEWMTDTGGLGLLLMGDCGRGKSIIITGMIPVLLAIKQCHTFPVHADDFGKPYPLAASTMGMDPNSKFLDYLVRAKYPIIDELGVEPLVNDYGEKYEGFNLVMNAAERYMRPVFISTNLTTIDMLNRYGERTMDRLQHLCRIVEFKGDSLR